jgi:putative ABC transport system permease protein
MPRIATIVDHLRQDFAYALRSLRRSPGFAATVVATLALGVGANAALFSLADRLFLRNPEGVAYPGSLRRLYERTDHTFASVLSITDGIGYPQYEAVRHGVAARAQTAAYTVPDSVRVGDDALPARGVYATANLLPMLGAHAALGRVFATDEDQMGNGALVAVISDAFWRARFGADPHIIGRVVSMARQRYTIIGVMQPGFTGVDLAPVDVWFPLATYAFPKMGSVPWYESWRSGVDVRVLARVPPHTPNEWLESAATSAFDRGEFANVQRHPDSATLLVGPIQAARGPSIQPDGEVVITTRLIGVAIIVLLIACANVTNLHLLRAHRRRREIAVRLALGVSRVRLVAQLLTEGAILAIIAGAASLLVGAWGALALRHAVLPPADAGGTILDWRITTFAISVALATGLLAGVTPALRASRPDLTTSLKAGSREGSSVEHSTFRAALVLAQAALSVVLLVGAGLFVRSLDSARAIDVGFDADRIVSATVYFADPQGHYVSYFDQSHLAEVTAGFTRVAARLRQVPGVQATALAMSPPMLGFAMEKVYLGGGRQAPNVSGVEPTVVTATSDYFRTVGAHLVRGRLFNERDNAGSEPVAVLNETAARAFWPGRDALGQCLMMIQATAPCTRVIGVVRDVHVLALVQKPIANLILPSSQEHGDGMFTHPGYLLVRVTPERRAAVIAVLRRTIREGFPTAEPPWIEASTTNMRNELAPWRLGASLFSAFGVLALIVTALGMYSVRAYSVSQRTHEMGVRMALGARGGQVMSLVIREGVRVVLIGIAVGVAASLALGRFVASLLYGTSPHDPIVLVAVALVLTFVSILASAVPARRAARTDPVVALRAD